MGIIGAQIDRFTVRAAGNQTARTATTGRCDTIAALTDLVAHGDVDVVLTGLRDRAGVPVTPALAALGTPRVPIVLLLDAAAEELRDARAALASGSYAGCLVRGHHDVHGELEAILAAPRRRGPELALVDEFVPLAADSVADIVLALALAASAGLRVTKLAGWLGVTERALYERCAAGDLPAPLTAIRYFIALRAAPRLAQPGSTVKGVAGALGFRRGEDLTGVIRAYAAMSTAEMRTPSGAAALHRHVANVLRGTEPPRRGPRRRQPSAAERRCHAQARPPKKPYTPPVITVLGPPRWADRSEWL